MRPPVTLSSEAPAVSSFSDVVRSPFVLLFAPDRGMPRQALVGRARWYFLFAWTCSIALGIAVAARVDVRSDTLMELEASGQLQSMSDRQILDETESAGRVAVVTSIAKAVVATPVDLGLACVGLVVMSWFFRGRLKGGAVAPCAAATLLPGAIANAVDAVTALRHAALPPGGAALGPRSLTHVLGLLGRPLAPPWIKLGNALDFYSLWAAVMLGFGVAAAGQIPRHKALAGTLIGWICVRLLSNVAAGG